MKKIIYTASLFLLLFTLISCDTLIPYTTDTPNTTNDIVSDTVSAEETQKNGLASDSYFEVYFIDVGQADCALLCCDGKYMLVDAGNVADSSLVYSFLNKHGVKRLDIVVGTHAHEDHMGGIAAPLNTLDIGDVYVPRIQSDAKFYQNFLSALKKKNITPKTPSPGDKNTLGSAQITFLGPVTESADDVNNTSIVFRVVYGQTSFMFTGDAGREEEAEILKLGYELKSDVLKVGHHGSSGSTSYVFLNEVLPQYAVISCGEGNSYGHPHEETLSRLDDADAIILRTDQLGDIKMTSDGKTVKVSTDNGEYTVVTDAKTEEECVFIGNINSHIFHSPDCSGLPAEKNRIYFTSREQAIEAGYTPCRNCKP